jgi:tetratricopeptide (TPR) repeat protein
MEEGARLFSEGRLREAGDVFRSLTRDYPNWADAQNNLAVVLAARGDYDGARQWLEAAVRSEPGYAGAYQNLGDTYSRLATLAYERAQQLERKVPEATPAPNPPAAQASGQAPTPAAEAGARADVSGSSDSLGDPRERAAVAKQIATWAAARSRRDIEAYVRTYEPNYSPDQESRGRWLDAQSAMLQALPRRPVQLENLRITVDGNQALARFRHTDGGTPRASSGNAAAEMALQLRRSATGQWLITREVSAPRQKSAAAG